MPATPNRCRPRRALLDEVLACTAIGDPATVAAQIRAFIDATGTDELMLTSNAYDHHARLRSYEIVAQQLLGSRGGS